MGEIKLLVAALDALAGRSMDVVRRLGQGDLAPEAAHLSLESMEGLLKPLSATAGACCAFCTTPARGLFEAWRALGRDYGGAHAGVVALIAVGLVERDEGRAVSVPWSRIVAEMALSPAA